MFFNNKNEEILNMLNIMESYLNNEINTLPNFDFQCNGFNKKIKDKLDSISLILNKKNDEEFLIYGEIMLVAEKMANGKFDDKIYHTNTSNMKLNYIAKTINDLVDHLDINIKQVLTVLDGYSNYNYLKSLNLESVDNDFKKLFIGINTLQKTITEMLLENKANGLTLDESSNMLLSNVDKLNVSSNEAAARLEETSAALEQITGNIKNNTQNIAKMANYSNSVTKSVNEGEVLASETTYAMDEINTQVRLINEAISVIDQIAFQTNILSLNAAVEAATAGEAGRGFAVVAAEVRNLASRSADAAKEIKQIVATATAKANEGKDIASNMIEGYKELNENISQTIELIKDIESASKEQLLGIEQINDAVIQLDQQTQQNAAVASKAHDIAMITDEISKLVVSNADAKEFEGKASVKSKTII